MNKNQENNLIYLENDIIRNSQIDDNAFISYVAIRTMLSCCKRNQDYIIYDYLAYLLCGQTGNKKIANAIKDGISKLSELSLVTCLNKTTIGQELKFDNFIFDTKEKHFTIIYESEIFNILNSNISYNIKMLRYFVTVISTLNHSKQTGNTTNNYQDVGNQSIQYLADMATIAPRTAITYNQWLEDKQLLYIVRSDKSVVNNNGKIEKSFKNCYGRYADKQSVDIAQMKIEDNWGANIGQKNLRDLKGLSKESKSLIAKMNYIKKGHIYPIDTYKEILQYYQNCKNNKKTDIRKAKEKYDKGTISETAYNDVKNQCIDKITEYNKNIDLLQALIPQQKNKSNNVNIVAAYFEKNQK